ncbi:MAG: dipeptidase [Thermaerobacter sp.]|nr:dipeptidase [Thermaerobacter sp.]
MPGTLDLDAALQYVRAHRDRHLQELREFLGIASVSAISSHAGDVRQAAQWLKHRLLSAGFSTVRVEETGGHPVVVATNPGHPDRPTVLVYGHYDVQPVDPLPAWRHPPFEPAIVDGALYARGASDDKGQVFMHVIAAEAWLRTGNELPVNLIFLLEGEEEIGSPHLGNYIASRQDLLRADLAVISDTPMYAEGVPAICYGLRGLAALELTVAGPKQDLHSGIFGGTVANPAHALATLIASLHDADQRVAVAGFYDDVDLPTPAERHAFAQLPFDDTAYQDEVGVPELAGEPGFSPLERTWIRPTVEVNGLWSGFSGEGQKTIIPASAHAKLTCRLVPHQDPVRVLDLLEAHLRAHCPKGVALTIARGEGAPGTVTPIDHPAVRSAEQAIRAVYGRPAAFIRMGGSIPVVVTLHDVLAMPTLLLGFALPNENFHAPNEHFHLDNFHRGAETVVRLWSLLAGWKREEGSQ